MARDDFNISDDYRQVILEYAEDDYEVFSKEEILCHQERLTWEEAKSRGEITKQCPPFWDKILCWAPLEVGVASQPCPESIRGILYDTSKSAQLECLSGGDHPHWANKSDYTACTPILPSDLPELLEDQNSETLSHIYFIGYSLSLVALIVATTIFLYFKEMRCLRNKIHSNLFVTFILADTCWITTAVMQTIQTVQNSNSSLEFSWCVSLIFSRYFHLATFFWMFVEGLFLFLQVIATFSVEDSRMKFRHYFLVGWGLPLVVVCLWAVFTQSKVLEERQKLLLSPNYTQALHHCPFMETTDHEWIYIGPVFLVLAANAFFLVSIFYVVVAKLRSTGQRETSDHQNWRAAKALLVIIPLLGITYLITIVPPLSPGSVFYPVFAHFRAILLSTQGFTVTLPYCFLNTEVKGILQHHWKRWRNTRNVEYNYSRGHSARNSISLAGYYACDSHSTVLTASRRNSFFRLHSQYLSGSGYHGARVQESGLVTSVLLERDSALRTNNRIIPVIQEEARTPSPALLTTVISVTPATPTQSKVSLQTPELTGGILLDKITCFSAGSSPRLEEPDTKHANSLIDLDIPTEGLNSKSLSSCTLPQQASKMPDILNFPPPKPGSFSASCPTVSDQHKEKR